MSHSLSPEAERDLRIHALRVGPLALPAEWAGPAHPRALVLFAHGSGSSHASPRNRSVAGVLNEHGLATLLFDLLDEAEAGDAAKATDIDLLTTRLTQVMQWLAEVEPAVLPGRLPPGWPHLGLFGASTGAAVALRAAAARPGQVFAVVSRGGRGDLAEAVLPQVHAPTLLIVGGADREVAALNRKVLLGLRCEKRLEVVPRASHLFEEPGALEAVGELAADWYLRHVALRPVG